MHAYVRLMSLKISKKKFVQHNLKMYVGYEVKTLNSHLICKHGVIKLICTMWSTTTQNSKNGPACIISLTSQK